MNDATGSRGGGAVVAYAVAPGVQGGMGHHASQVVAAVVGAGDVTAFGPAPIAGIPAGGGLRFVHPPPFLSSWQRRLTWRRYLLGRLQLEQDRRFGRWFAGRVAAAPARAYMFTQIGLEAMRAWRGGGTLAVLDNPNGHIRDYHDATRREAGRWLSLPYPQHPCPGMVDRVEEEYALAGRIRVASGWAARSMTARGVEPGKIAVVPHAVDLDRFHPGPPRDASGPLRVVAVGGVSLGKGFPYLLEAMRRVGPRHLAAHFVGGTGDPWCRRLFDRLRQGLIVTEQGGDPVGPYQHAELLVLPTVHDGFGFVVAEAMACGLPVITTDCCGAAEWIREHENGWVVRAADVDSLAAALDSALRERERLPAMGESARATAAALGGAEATTAVRRFVRASLGLPLPEEAAVASMECR